MKFFLAPLSDEWLALKLDPNGGYLPNTEPVKTVRIPGELTPAEAGQAFAALLRLERSKALARERETGRRASKAKYGDWLRLLAACRLRRYMTATEALEFWKATAGMCPYSSASSFYRAADQAETYIDWFNQKAGGLAANDIWIPPFGVHLLDLESI